MKKISFLFALLVGLLLFAGCSNKKASADNWAAINEEKKNRYRFGRYICSYGI